MNMPTQTEQTSAPDNQIVRTDYHYITTVQTSDVRINTRDGILSVPAGYTRQQAFAYLLKQLTEEYGSPISVLYFEFEPNAL